MRYEKGSTATIHTAYIFVDRYNIDQAVKISTCWSLELGEVIIIKPSHSMQIQHYTYLLSSLITLSIDFYYLLTCVISL